MCFYFCWFLIGLCFKKEGIIPDTLSVSNEAFLYGGKERDVFHQLLLTSRFGKLKTNR